MSDDAVGLDETRRRAIAAEVSAALAVVPEPASERDAGPMAQGLAAATAHLLNRLLREHGYDGVFEVACALVAIIAEGHQAVGSRGVTFPPAGPGLAEQVMADMGTALVAGDRFAARLHFDALQPEQDPYAHPVAPAMMEAMARLFYTAWARQSGRTSLTLVTPPGERWPPLCDYCGHAVAGWLYRCVGVDVSMGTPGTERMVAVHLTDADTWYACRVCRALLDARPPRWGELVARRARLQGGEAVGGLTLSTWKAVHRLRTTRRPEPLPAHRPEPTRPPP